MSSSDSASISSPETEKSHHHSPQQSTPVEHHRTSTHTLPSAIHFHDSFTGSLAPYSHSSHSLADSDYRSPFRSPSDGDPTSHSHSSSSAAHSSPPLPTHQSIPYSALKSTGSNQSPHIDSSPSSLTRKQPISLSPPPPLPPPPLPASSPEYQILIEPLLNSPQHRQRTRNKNTSLHPSVKPPSRPSTLSTTRPSHK